MVLAFDRPIARRIPPFPTFREFIALKMFERRRRDARRLHRVPHPGKRAPPVLSMGGQQPAGKYHRDFGSGSANGGWLRSAGDRPHEFVQAMKKRDGSFFSKVDQNVCYAAANALPTSLGLAPLANIARTSRSNETSASAASILATRDWLEPKRRASSTWEIPSFCRRVFND
jgi:hypothetical protein